MKKTVHSAVITIGGFAVVVQCGGWSLLASALAGIQGYKSVSDYLSQGGESGILALESPEGIIQAH